MDSNDPVDTGLFLCFLKLLEEELSVLDFGGEASGLLLMGGANTESSSTGVRVFSLVTSLTGKSRGAGDNENGKVSIAPGIPEGVALLLADVGCLSPPEDGVSLFGRRSDDPGVAIVAIIFDMGRGVDSSSGRNSFSSSAVIRDESLVSMI